MLSAPGTGNFWRNYTRNTDASIPAIPNIPASTGYGSGNNSNRLSAGTYYYGVSVVYKGLEGPMYIYGAGSQTSAAVSGSPTAVTIAAGNIAQLEFDMTTPAITNLGVTYPRQNVKFRIYRAGGPNASAPVNLTDFSLLMECGCPTTGNARCWDNGMYIPGCDTSFGITTIKDGVRGWAMYQLLPLMLRKLADLPMASPIVLLWFATLLLRVRRQHMVIRNLGRS